MNLEPLELESPCTGKTVETRRALTLAELGHDADRDRTTHLFMAGYDDTARNEPIAAPSSSRRSGRVTAHGERTCVSSVSLSPPGCVTRVTTTTRNGSKAADPIRPTDYSPNAEPHPTPQTGDQPPPHHHDDGGLATSLTLIENYEPDDEGWGIVIGPLFAQRPTTPSEEQREEEPSNDE